MKTKYKYIHFQQVSDDRWGCITNKNNDVLGTIAFYPCWRCYNFAPVYGTEFSPDCLRDIADFMEQLKRQHSLPTWEDVKGIFTENWKGVKPK